MANHANSTTVPEVQPGLALQTVNAERQPVVQTVNGEVMADSRDVAASFGKNHFDVLKAMRNLNCSAEFRQRNFASFKINDLTGESTSHVLMTKDGFSFLVLGFTGRRAGEFKERYIQAFNTMEAELRARPRIMIDFTDPKVLLGVLDHLKGEVDKKDAVIAAQVERLEKLDRIEGSDGSMSISEAAKGLKFDRIQDLFAFLQSRRWIFKRAGSKSWLARQEVIVAGYMEHADHLYRDKQGRDMVGTRALVTAKGWVKISAMLAEKLN